MGEFLVRLNDGPVRTLRNTWHAEGGQKLWERAFGSLDDTVAFEIGLSPRGVPKNAWQWISSTQSAPDLGRPAAIATTDTLSDVDDNEGGAINEHHLRVIQYARQDVDMLVEECSHGIEVRSRTVLYDPETYDFEPVIFRNRAPSGSIACPALGISGARLTEYPYESAHGWPWGVPYHYRGSVGNVLGTTSEVNGVRVFTPAWKKCTIRTVSSALVIKPQVGVFDLQDGFEHDLAGYDLYYCAITSSTGKWTNFKSTVNESSSTHIHANNNGYISTPCTAWVSVRPTDDCYEEMDKNGFRLFSLPVASVFLCTNRSGTRELVASAAMADLTRLGPGSQLEVQYRGFMLEEPA